LILLLILNFGSFGAFCCYRQAFQLNCLNEEFDLIEVAHFCLDDGHTVVIEYEVHGTILRTGVTYDNRFCSIIKLENRKIAHWRDYMDSLAAWNALTASPR
jgi:ketosteroid isomerase-like protein